MMKRGVKRPALKKMIRREIARNVENKTQQHYNFQQTLYTPGDGSLFANGNVIPLGCGPSSIIVSQGVGQGQRTGNAIKTKRLMFKGTIVPAAYDAIFNAQPVPLMVKMWIFYDKTVPTTLPNPDAAADFFQNGSGVRSFERDLVDMWTPINTDRYRVLTSRVFKLGYASYTGTGSLPTQGNFANNDFKYNCNFNINLTKYYPKTVKFVDGSTSPTTRGLFCMFEYVWANGGQLPVGNRSAVVQYMLNYVYEDA
uniref:Capsid protein n=1 Tax=Pavo cristatus CRESS-DNA-virus sp. TaxID=2815049 RepID=A0A8A4XCY1_9VIRU|nr:MAG: capsid protein [Pavo cristatus CRESS-DNA-virus sp.]